MRILFDGRVSKIVYDKQKKIVTKTLKQKKVDAHALRLYKEFQKTAPVVKVIDQIDDYTYTMEYIPNIVDTVHKFTEHWRDETRWLWTKANCINLHNTMSETWQSAMRISKNVDKNIFFVNNDFRLENIVVVKEKSGDYTFKCIDPDSWVLTNGYYGMDSYYQSQLKIALVMQRMLA